MREEIYGPEESGEFIVYDDGDAIVSFTESGNYVAYLGEDDKWLIAGVEDTFSAAIDSVREHRSFHFTDDMLAALVILVGVQLALANRIMLLSIWQWAALTVAMIIAAVLLVIAGNGD